MLVAIERTKFTYLYKYNQVRVDTNQLIDKSIVTLQIMLSSELSSLAMLFNKALPIFEQDHEIILLEIDKSKVIFQDGISISFDSIKCIYPLTKTGLQLLDGKLNDDFIIAQPIFEDAIEVLRLKRSMDFRKATAAKLLIHYNLELILSNPNLSLIESAVEKNLLHKSKPQVFNTFLDNLVAYNKTPSFIPDGNIEFICKIGAITYQYLGKAEEAFTNGPFYKSSIKYKSKINSPSILESYQDFNMIRDAELNSSTKTMTDIISKDYTGIDIFKVSYFFLAYKSYLNRHDNNIALVNNEIEAFIANDKQSASFVLAMLGLTFSIENIYEGLHKLSNAPLLKSTRNKILAENEKRKRIESELEQQHEDEKATLDQTKFNLNQDKQKTENKLDATVSLNSIEIESGSTINSPSENELRAVVIHDNNPHAKDSEIEKTNQEVSVEKKPATELIPATEKKSERDTPTVEIFKKYLTEKLSESKQNIWFEHLDLFFPDKKNEITLESLMGKLDAIPEVKKKLLKSQKDKEPIKSFFNSSKKIT